MQFRILGPLEVLEHDQALALGGAKQRAVLAILLISRGQVLSSERLIDELWGERPPATAAKTLHGYISHLRKAIGDEPLQTRGRGYLLWIEREQLDADRFERLAAEGRGALSDGDPARAAERLREALGLWRGPALAEFAYEPFAEVEIARLGEARLAALEDRLDADLELGRHGHLIGELEALTREHPLRERLRGQLMLALYRCGRQAHALEAYQAARRALVDELGIEPGRALRELHGAIIQQDPRLDVHDSRPRPAAPGPARSVFVGRERELGELMGALEDAFVGHGRLVVLVGEPGIGKSRLAEEIASHARARGARVHVGRCWEAGGAPAFWPWVQSLRSYVRAGDGDELVGELGDGAVELAPILPELYELIPGLPPPTAPESESARFRLFQAVAEFVRRASKKHPVVLILDDLHAADAPSMLLVQFIARELGSMHVLLVVTMRDVDPVPGEQLTEMLAELARESATRRLSLAGLSEHDVGQYIELAASEIASTQLASALYAETEGNPLFVSETVRLLSLEAVHPEPAGAGRLAIPQSVRDVIARRLARLSPECGRILALASVLGREFALDTLAVMADAPEGHVLDTLDEALIERVVSEVPGAPGRLRFAHVLIRDTLFAGLTAARRVQLHRLASAALMTRHGDQHGAHLAELAHHSISGRDFERARVYATRAGDWAMGLLAYEEAARLYTTALDALELLEPPDHHRRCELLLSLGEARTRAGDSAAAQASFLEAAELARHLGLGRELARAAAGYGGRIVWARAGKDSRVIQLLESGLAALSEEDVELRARLLARLAGALRDEPSMDRRDALSCDAVELARRGRDPRVLAYTLEGRASIIGGRPGTGAEQSALANELLELADRSGDRERVVPGHYLNFIAAIGVGDVSSAEAALTAAAKVAKELRQPAQLWQVSAARAMLALAAGRLTEAEEFSAQALRLGERAQRDIAIPTHTLQCFTLRDFQGRLAEMETPIQAAVAEYATQPVYRCALAYLHARLAHTAPARQALDELATDEFTVLPLDNEWLYATSLLAEACSILHDTDAASVLYRMLSPYPDYNVVDTPDAIRGSVSRYLGLLASTMGRLQDAATHFDHGLAMNDRMGARPWLAHTQHDYAGTLLARDGPGDHERAQQLLGQALATYRELCMNTYVARASALSRQVNTAPQPTP